MYEAGPPGWTAAIVTREPLVEVQLPKSGTQEPRHFLSSTGDVNLHLCLCDCLTLALLVSVEFQQIGIS